MRLTRGYRIRSSGKQIRFCVLSLDKVLGMQTSKLREKRTEYIKVADDKKIVALYTLLEDEIESEYKWFEDEAFIAELEEDARKIDSGEEKVLTEEEAFAMFQAPIDKHKMAHV